MQFQDWEPIVFNKHADANLPKYKKPNRENSPTRKLLNETDVPVLNYIDSETKNKIITMRNKKGLTQVQLAQKLSVAPNVIAGYESGKVIPNKQFVQRIFKALA
jgi:ribosome-binding protein aMBF1 (putative translation factor)